MGSAHDPTLGIATSARGGGGAQINANAFLQCAFERRDTAEKQDDAAGSPTDESETARHPVVTCRACAIVLSVVELVGGLTGFRGRTELRFESTANRSTRGKQKKTLLRVLPFVKSAIMLCVIGVVNLVVAKAVVPLRLALARFIFTLMCSPSLSSK